MFSGNGLQAESARPTLLIIQNPSNPQISKVGFFCQWIDCGFFLY